MKKTNVLLGIFLIALFAAGIWGIMLGMEEEAQNLGGIGNYALSAPRLSRESGFYDEPFSLSISAPDNASIYYTLDGSRPTADSYLYTDPILISGQDDILTIQNIYESWIGRPAENHNYEAVVIRAVAMNEGGCSDIVTGTYFISRDDLKEHIVISLVADPGDLFGDNGIYVTGKAYDDWYLGGQAGEAPVPNFLQKGKAWERPGVMEWFEEESLVQQPIGIRIQGASARWVANKRFSVYARKDYGGSPWFDIPLFGDWRTHSFVLRSGFMNGYIQHLVQDRDIISADSKEVIVYLNGARWYTTIAQEKISERLIQEKYGVDKDNVIIVKNGASVTGDPEDQSLYQSIYDFMASNDMEDMDVYERFCQIIDIQSYIDFSCVNIYFGNLDYNETKNIMCWRARKPGYGEYGDGRWRWALYDMDLENLDYGVIPEEINTFTTETHYAGGAFNTRPMWVALKQNALFRQQFVTSFMDMVNTDFTADRASGAMDSWEITPVWWGMDPDWTESYFPARTAAVTGFLAEEMGLEGTCETLELSVSDPEAGYISLNTILPDLFEGEWSGIYFTDYPVTVVAVPKEGYLFSDWKSTDPSLDGQTSADVTARISPGGLTLQAIFTKK